MKQKLLVLMFLLTVTPFLFSKSYTPEAQEFKSIQELIKETAKLTQDDTKKSTLKFVRSQLVRVSELWDAGYIPNTLPVLLNVRAILYRYGSSETVQFQQNVKSAMRRLWPFILKSGRFKSDAQTFQGVSTVNLIVPEGRFVFTIPTDARPGELVSGGIQSYPENLGSLYLLTIAGSPVVPDQTLRKWTLPQTFDFLVTDVWGNELIHARQQLAPEATNTVDTAVPGSQFPLEKPPREVRPNIEIPHLRFQISSRAKAGEHLIIEGPFDGDYSTTLAGIGKFQAQILAESPRRLVLGIHPRMTGPWTILIVENENRIRCRVNVGSETVDPFATLATCTPP